MEIVRRRVATRSVVAAGSVWESRMKMDEVKGGITVFNGEEEDEDNAENEVKPSKRSIQKILSPRPSGKRKTWKSDPSENFEKPRIQIAKNLKDSDDRTDISKKNLAPRRTRPAVATDEIQRSPSQSKKTRSEKPNSESVKSKTVEKSTTQIDVEEPKSDEVCNDFGVCEANTLPDSKSNRDDIDADSNIKEIDIEELKPESSEKKTNNGETSSDQDLQPMVLQEEKIIISAPEVNLITSPGVRKFDDLPEANSLQYLVNLVMWRDVSRSAFAFGVGTFFMISSSCANDINVSSVSVVSYMGLVYLAIVFIYRSVICRGVLENYGANRGFIVEEEDAVWLLQVVLPYINEFLLKLRNLFSGDPATTIKLALLLYVLARCGSWITLWNLLKFGFFGAFTIPKIYSSYSSKIMGHVNFWVDRFADAWISCSHKKVVAGAIFTLVWNLSSVVARVWAVFVLFVAVRYYQQYMQSTELATEEVEDACGVSSPLVGKECNDEDMG